MKTQIWIALALSCAPRTPPEPAPETAAEPAPELNAEAVMGVADPALRRLLHDDWEGQLAASPLWASRWGDTRYDHLLSDTTAAGAAAEEARIDALLARARTIEPAGLNQVDRVTLELLVLKLEQQVAGRVCAYRTWSFSVRSNPLTAINQVAELHRVYDQRSADALLARYAAFPAYAEGWREGLREGAAAGRYATAESARLTAEMLERQLEKPSAEWSLAAAELEGELAAAPDDAAAFQAARLALIDDAIRPALEQTLALLRDEILPNARPAEASGMVALPDGEACYAAMIHQHTTLPLAAAEIHQTGLDELERIHDGFRDLGEGLFETRDLQAIFERLRTDPALYFDTEDAVADKAAEALARAGGALDGVFGIQPQAGCEIRRVPDYEAPYSTIAYYQPPNPDGSKPGEYFVNTYAPETRPRYEAEVLAFHEAIPGHHLQIAIAGELPALPAARRYARFTAFVEGWALYSEQLSDEMGLYSGDLDRMGMWSFESWRAARLVVDTGIHAFGWSREQAIDFMIENTPLAENNIVNEVDRYVSWPGQALAYKTGQLHIWRLRRGAEARLGERFVLADFHDVVLGAGSVPLAVLERRVMEWVEATEDIDASRDEGG